MPEQRRVGKRDRTKDGATPRRGSSGHPAGTATGRVRPLLLAVLGTALGVAVLVGGVLGLHRLAADQRLPQARLTVTSCTLTGHGRAATTHCDGTGDAARPLRLADAAERYAPGTVLTVHCDTDGHCAAPSPGRWFVTTAVLLGGLLATAAGLTALARPLPEPAAPHRPAALRRRVLRIGAATAALLALAGCLAHAFGAN